MNYAVAGGGPGQSRAGGYLFTPDTGRSSAAGEFNYAPVQGAGSNQYQALPPWMNTSSGAVQNPQSTFQTPQPTSGSPNYASGYQSPWGFTRADPTNPVNTMLESRGIAPVGTPGANAYQQEQAIFGPNMPQWQPFSSSEILPFSGSYATGGNVNVPGGSTGPSSGYSTGWYSGFPLGAGGTAVPGTENTPTTGAIQSGYFNPSIGGTSYAGGWSGAGHGPVFNPTGPGYAVEQPTYPNLSQSYANWLGTQIGQGLPAFSGSVNLPFGGTTQPGQLNAPANQVLQQLMSGYTGGQSSIPGFNALANIATKGVDTTPEYQAFVNQMGQSTAQNEAQMKEQGAFMGGLAGTPTGNAMSNLIQGIAAQQANAAAQFNMQGLLQGQIPAAEQMLGGATNFGQYAQGLNQQAIQNYINQHYMDLPQFNPMNQYIASYGQMFSPMAQNPPQGGGILGGIAGAAPGIFQTIAATLPAAGTAA